MNQKKLSGGNNTHKFNNLKFNNQELDVIWWNVYFAEMKLMGQIYQLNILFLDFQEALMY